MPALAQAGTLLEFSAEFRSMNKWMNAAELAGLTIKRIRTGLVAFLGDLTKGEWDKRTKFGYLDL